MNPTDMVKPPKRIKQITCAKNGVSMAPTLAHEDDVPSPEARIDVGYTYSLKTNIISQDNTFFKVFYIPQWTVFYINICDNFYVFSLLSDWINTIKNILYLQCLFFFQMNGLLDMLRCLIVSFFIAKAVSVISCSTSNIKKN